MASEFLRLELESNFKRSGYTANRTIIAHGPQCAEPHNIGTGPIRANETIVADIFPRSDMTGYWGDMTRTFVKGQAARMVKNAFKAVLKASEAAKKYVRLGASPRAGQAIISAAKVKALIKGRFNVSYSDVNELAYPVLRHRMKMNFEAIAERVSADDVITMIIDELGKKFKI